MEYEPYMSKLLKYGETLRILWAFFIFILFYFSFFNFGYVLNKIIIPRTLIGYEMIKDNSSLRAKLAVHNLISNESLWNNC